ncbi:hypothetical protein RJ639_001750 [Escallonia herrerae]|uniref:Uncharacterized protein n=1 Tax=Escallonia herrerae TaxID=1293975 RepID=A0AA88X940_9ASTE|nr:hypothetical protein RJ639_001750 [Escallonia herrerae]
MIKVALMVELLEEYRVVMARVREQLFLPRHMRPQLMRDLRSAASPSSSTASASFFLGEFTQKLRCQQISPNFDFDLHPWRLVRRIAVAASAGNGSVDISSIGGTVNISVV